MDGQLNLEFDNSKTIQTTLETEAKHSKHKKVVCHYWLKNTCAKGSLCEFLHMLDYSKMPFCPLGQYCSQKDCFYKHYTQKRSVCANYQLGFCSFGKRCPHFHEQFAGPVPDVSAYWTPEYQAKQRELCMVQESKTFRKKPCEYYAKNLWCPYFDMCNFQH